MALSTSAFSSSQLDDIYKRNPTWAQNLTQTKPTTQTPATAPNQQQQPTATPNSASVTGGIDFSNIKPQFSVSGSTGTSANNSQSGLSQMGNNALAPLLGTGQGSMPNLIDDWTNNVMSKLTVSQNDIMDQINQAANIQAQKGIMGGTEANNLRATMLRQLIQPTLQQQAQTLTSGMAAKAQAMPNLIGLTQQSGSTGSANNNSMSYGQSPQDYQIIADMIRAGWTG